ncbi:hypothetical protein BELL_0138g00140 [Botrytis elliptica]|uniref:Uncharacterized protein n=1 Tax=Botrytis elliptica TaxID=278938 RepID=A0A4Z1JYI5_9HELO|nr:hypothetical protein BELL_0138g00140 [Botrytis elliptica]
MSPPPLPDSSKSPEKYPTSRITDSTSQSVTPSNHSSQPGEIPSTPDAPFSRPRLGLGRDSDEEDFGRVASVGLGCSGGVYGGFLESFLSFFLWEPGGFAECLDVKAVEPISNCFHSTNEQETSALFIVMVMNPIQNGQIYHVKSNNPRRLI